MCAGNATYADGASEEATWLALHSPGGAIQRALSCDSVGSEASLADFENVDEVSNNIGQLEFSIQYLRYVSELCVQIIVLNLSILPHRPFTFPPIGLPSWTLDRSMVFLSLIHI